MNESICLITGANSGIGKTTAIQIARSGMRVVIVCRTREKAEASCDEIKRESGSSAVDWLTADLSSQPSIRQVASEYQSRYGKLDVLLNNAGVAPKNRQLTAEGLEMTFAVNHLGYFLLTQQLFPCLKAADSARIVNVASEAHRSGRLNFENLQGEQKYSTWGAYSLSKLCNILFTLELARRIDSRRITANALHPGFVATSIFRDTPGFFKFMVRRLALDPEKGAENSFYLATSPEVQNVTGKYFVKQKPVQPAPQALDSGSAKKLWELSEKLTDVSFSAS